MEVMGKIRESSMVPIIIISAKDTDSDKTLGLGLGADDYITKPFSVTEVLARIKANIRRTTQYAAGTSMQQPVLIKGALTMDLNAYSVKKDGKEIELTAKEFEIFTSVMLASFIVSAYKNKTMNLMFTYPVKRRKILVSQMMAVWSFNFAALVLSKLVIYLCIFMGSKYMRSSFAIDFDMGSLSFYIQLILKSFVIVSMSFITLFVGMAVKSSKAAIITSFLLIFLTQANVGDFTM